MWIYKCIGVLHWKADESKETKINILRKCTLYKQRIHLQVKAIYLRVRSLLKVVELLFHLISARKII